MTCDVAFVFGVVLHPLVQIDTNSSVKREGAGNASLSQLLLTSPFSSNDNARFTANDALGQPSANNVDIDPAPASAAQVRMVHTVACCSLGTSFSGPSGA